MLLFKTSKLSYVPIHNCETLTEQIVHKRNPFNSHENEYNEVQIPIKSGKTNIVWTTPEMQILTKTTYEVYKAFL